MTQITRKRIFASARLVLCAAFIYLAVRGVTVHDYVTLAPAAEVAGGDEITVRLVTETESTVTVVEVDGSQREVPRSRVARNAEGDEEIKRGLITALRSCDPFYLVCGLLIFAPVTFLQSARFRIMLAAQDIRISYFDSVKLCFAGNFLNFVFLLGSTAGDLYKAYYTAVHTERKTEAVTTILLDRIVGLVGLVIVAGSMSFVGTSDAAMRSLGITALVLLGCVLVGVWMVSSPRAPLALIRRLIARLPGSVTLERVLSAAERLVHSRGKLAAAVAIAVVLQFIAVGAAVMLAFALGMDFSGSKLWDYFAYIGGGNMIAAIPITAQGLGTMELAYKVFFLDTHGTLAQLLCLALWIRLMNLLWALPGALVTLLGAHRPRESRADLAESASTAATPTSDTAN